ncbi:hypothetical protein [Sphingosinicella sp. BN140058]|uniref:hypothetical protein n=1 Tax=Sphingosinicella sp. BN140058 TaxID=1892855 RepID=UPI00101356F0|nr:hypothetical protein [Sphingosinicella sp. BN140058]QAY78064.1 hypothetical protein ETR14_17195 [Sphingosinicella sp. BN140058]
MAHFFELREDVELIGARLRRVIPLPEWGNFDRLLLAIDQADAASGRQSQARAKPRPDGAARKPVRS